MVSGHQRSGRQHDVIQSGQPNQDLPELVVGDYRRNGHTLELLLCGVNY